MENKRASNRNDSWINFEKIESILSDCNIDELVEIKLLVSIELAKKEAFE